MLKSANYERIFYSEKTVTFVHDGFTFVCRPKKSFTSTEDGLDVVTVMDDDLLVGNTNGYEVWIARGQRKLASWRSNIT